MITYKKTGDYRIECLYESGVIFGFLYQDAANQKWYFVPKVRGLMTEAEVFDIAQKLKSLNSNG